MQKPSGFVSSMSDEADREHRSEQIARTFALLTAKLEDAAALAAEGQGPRTDDQLRTLTQQIAELSGEATTVAAAMACLIMT